MYLAGWSNSKSKETGKVRYGGRYPSYLAQATSGAASVSDQLVDFWVCTSRNTSTSTSTSTSKTSPCFYPKTSHYIGNCCPSQPAKKSTRPATMVRPSLLITMRFLTLFLFLLAIASTNAIPTGEQRPCKLVTVPPSRC